MANQTTLPTPDDIAREAVERPMRWGKPWMGDNKVHAWRNYIGDRTRTLWDTFTDEQKIALAGDADDQAGCEEWE